MQLAAWLQAEGLAAVPGLQDALLEVASTVDELKQLTSEDVTALLDALPSEAAGQSAAAAMRIRALRDRLVAEYEAASIPLLEAELTQACEQLWVPALDAALPYRRRPPLHEVLFDVGRWLLGWRPAERPSGLHERASTQTGEQCREADAELERELSAALNRVLEAAPDQPVLELGRQLLVAGALTSLVGSAVTADEPVRRRVWRALRGLQAEAEADAKPGGLARMKDWLAHVGVSELCEAYWADRAEEEKQQRRKQVEELQRSLGKAR